MHHVLGSLRVEGVKFVVTRPPVFAVRTNGFVESSRVDAAHGTRPFHAADFYPNLLGVGQKGTYGNGTASALGADFVRTQQVKRIGMIARNQLTNLLQIDGGAHCTLPSLPIL